jgi:hypothetical protein
MKPKALSNTKHNIGIHGNDYIALITVPNRWGKGDTVKDAKRQVRHAGGDMSGPWRLYAVHKDTFVNEYGQLTFPKDSPPVMVEEYDPVE